MKTPRTDAAYLRFRDDDSHRINSMLAESEKLERENIKMRAALIDISTMKMGLNRHNVSRIALEALK